MSVTSRALVFKYLMTFVVSVIALSMFGDNSWPMVALYAVVATAANYLIGDLVILPSMGNLVASVADGGLAALAAYLMSMMSVNFSTTPGNLLTLGILVAIGEFFFHQFLKKSDKVAP